MKKQAATLILLLLTFFSTVMAQNNVDSLEVKPPQEKFNVALGIGIPELIYVGLAYQVSQFQFGITLGGGDNFDGGGWKSYTAYGKLHLLGNSKYSERKPWYAMVSYNYSRRETYRYHAKINRYDMIKIAFGKDFNVSNRFGFYFDLGPAVEIDNYTTYKDSDGRKYGKSRPLGLLPGINTGMYFRL